MKANSWSGCSGSRPRVTGSPALRRTAAVRAVAGFRFGENLGVGPFLYVDDLVTAEAGRSAAGAGCFSTG